MNSRNRNVLTLKDVAARLEVSTATISNAFSRPDQLSVELRERILKACREMGYHGPNAAARSLRTGRTGTVGVVLADRLSYSVTDPVANQFLEGIAEVLDKQHHSMLLLSHDHLLPNQNTPRIGFFGDGLIIYGLQYQSDRQLRLPTRNVVTVDCKFEGITSVLVDNFSGAKASAIHAFRHAPKRVAILGLRMLNNHQVTRLRDNDDFSEVTPVSKERLRGYQEAANECDITLDSHDIWHIPENVHHYAYQAAREALSISPRPELLLCMSDRIAIAAVQAAQRMGLRVPEDIKIVGFDGIPAATTMHPSLTTVHQHSVEKGRKAAEIFLGMRPQQDIVLTSELIIGESCP
ncbi:LacI family transcriptional regulator [Hahella sp. CCB-MM4]|uniref:LacI family DNA-binding transcriptional regulator n=1 Tax=Hahella sp. (strain CCB-MM4) TaxID=1926491 RepID=UPI000B9A29CD|nr:LacI family DNA-binding transcriptional regulator [Hahella sp. CCB-MM4]OZG74230.1 LacI family transcriptional regulator [Hahella sp. CCB-MM4]